MSERKKKKENLSELKDLNFYFTDDMKQTLFDMVAIQNMLDHEELNYKELKQLENEKLRLLNHFREELQVNNPVEVEIVREFLQMKNDERN